MAKLKKIVVIGFSSFLKRRDMIKIFKSKKVFNRIIFITDESLKKTATNMMYTKEYADAIFIGPTPHKVKGMTSSKSLYDALIQNHDKYPMVVPVSCFNGGFKITKSSLERAIEKFIRDTDDALRRNFFVTPQLVQT